MIPSRAQNRIAGRYRAGGSGCYTDGLGACTIESTPRYRDRSSRSTAPTNVRASRRRTTDSPCIVACGAHRHMPHRCRRCRCCRRHRCGERRLRRERRPRDHAVPSTTIGGCRSRHGRGRRRSPRRRRCHHGGRPCVGHRDRGRRRPCRCYSRQMSRCRRAPKDRQSSE